MAQACACQHPRGRDPVPSRGAHRRRALRLPLGRRAQARAARRGRLRHDASDDRRPVRQAPRPRLAERVAALDWDAASAAISTRRAARCWSGCCRRRNAGRSPRSIRRRAFRSRVVMARHGFGRGEYKYFAYPLPGLVVGLRTALYPRLAPIANRWNEAMGIDVRYPRAHADSSSAAIEAGQTRPTPLLLQYGAGRLQLPAPGSLRRPSCFRCRWRSCCPSPDADFTGGEFVLTEQRPRMQSRAEVVPLAPGRCGYLRGASSSGTGHARHLPRQSAPRRQPAAVRPAPHARHHLPRCQVERSRCSICSTRGPMLGRHAAEARAAGRRGGAVARILPPRRARNFSGA